MADELVVPPDILPEQPSKIELVDDQTADFKPMFSRRWSQRNSFGDPFWKITHRFRGLRQSDATRMHAVIAEAQGAYRTIMVGPAQAIRGSWATHAGGELFTNADFSNGTTGWSTGGTSTTISTADGVLKLIAGAGGGVPQVYQTVVVTQYAPHVLRVVTRDDLGSAGVTGSPSIQTPQIEDVRSTRGYAVVTNVMRDASGNNFPYYLTPSSGYGAGTAVLIQFTSLSRCFLADGGGNLITYSDQLDNAAWSSVGLGSVSNNAIVAPDGTTTGELLNQDTSGGGHYRYQAVTVAASAADITLSCCFRASNRGWAFLVMEEGIGGHHARAWFNLTGSVGTVDSTGSNWTNPRAFIVDKGNGWYECHLVARKINAATSVQMRLCASTADAVAAYSGSAEGAVYVWRASSHHSGVPARGQQTTTPNASASAQGGAGIYVKGLPVSQSGLLVPGDWVEIDGQLKRVTASLDSNAAGLGYLQVRPQVYREIADNTPIIVTKPLGRFRLSGNASHDAMFGSYADYQLTFDEVYE
jgi:hypothetical protein